MNNIFILFALFYFEKKNNIFIIFNKSVLIIIFILKKSIFCSLFLTNFSHYNKDNDHQLI